MKKTPIGCASPSDEGLVLNGQGSASPVALMGPGDRNDSKPATTATLVFENELLGDGSCHRLCVPGPAVRSPLPSAYNLGAEILTLFLSVSPHGERTPFLRSESSHQASQQH